MHKIRDWLFVSGFPEASSKSMVQSENITAMLQLFEPIDYDDVETLYLETMDGYPLLASNIKEGVDFVLEQHKQGKTILISCGAGVSRSVTYTIAVLKELEKLSLPDAYRAVRKHHKEALPDQTHWKSLNEYYGETTPFWEIWEEVLLENEDKD